MLNLLFALIGLLTGGLINVLADDLPKRVRPKRPYCPNCGYQYTLSQWLAVGRRLWGSGRCPTCQLPTRRRALLVEVGTAVLFALLPLFLTEMVNLVIIAFYQAVLILIIVIDLEHRLILNNVTYPVTLLALLASFLVTDNDILFALLGAIVGFLFFLLTYLIGHRLFGAGALGFGDVKLAMMMGAMLGLHRVVFALVIGILLGGVISAVLLASRRYGRNAYLPYGQYLAAAGMIMLIWGCQTLAWYTDMEFSCNQIGSVFFP